MKLLDVTPINPGSFHKAEQEDPTPEINIRPICPESSQFLAAKYLLFRSRFNPKADVVYHPCCGNEVSPSVAFPDSRVVYVELDKKSVEALKDGGFEVHFVSALEFNPGSVDILILLNPSISPDIPCSYVLEGGFVLCNDYHGTTSDLHKNSKFNLVAIIRLSSKGELIVDTEKLDDYWKEIETDEEFKNAPMDWGTTNYEMAASIVEAITGKIENILIEYKKIIALAKEERQKNYQEMLDENPSMEDLPESLISDDLITFNYQGRQFFLTSKLPRKRGTVDDTFVFRKKRVNE